MVGRNEVVVLGSVSAGNHGFSVSGGIIERLPEINQVTVKSMKQASSESSKTRRITLISAPTNEWVMVMEKQGQWFSCPYCLEGILNPAKENAMQKR